jgi:hypothetical protein
MEVVRFLVRVGTLNSFKKRTRLASLPCTTRPMEGRSRWPNALRIAGPTPWWRSLRRAVAPPCTAPRHRPTRRSVWSSHSWRRRVRVRFSRTRRGRVRSRCTVQSYETRSRSRLVMNNGTGACKRPQGAPGGVQDPGPGARCCTLTVSHYDATLRIVPYLVGRRPRLCLETTRYGSLPRQERRRRVPKYIKVILVLVWYSWSLMSQPFNRSSTKSHFEPFREDPRVDLKRKGRWSPFQRSALQQHVQASIPMQCHATLRHAGRGQQEGSSIITRAATRTFLGSAPGPSRSGRRPQSP